MRTTPRQRRALAPGVITALTPLFRYSQTRDAYVLRLMGTRVGPVLVPARHDRSRRGDA